MIKNLLLVGMGGAIGFILRFACSILFNTRLFPWSTLFINIIGCFFIDLIFAFGIRDIHFSNNWKLFIATGILHDRNV